jgi:hypothetical protein
MRTGVSFPHQAMGLDTVALRDWAQAAEGLGLDYIVVYEHIIFPDAASHPDQTFRYTNETALHEGWWWGTGERSACGPIWRGLDRARPLHRTRARRRSAPVDRLASRGGWGVGPPA